MKIWALCLQIVDIYVNYYVENLQIFTIYKIYKIILGVHKYNYN